MHDVAEKTAPQCCKKSMGVLVVGYTEESSKPVTMWWCGHCGKVTRKLGDAIDDFTPLPTQEVEDVNSTMRAIPELRKLAAALKESRVFVTNESEVAHKELLLLVLRNLGDLELQAHQLGCARFMRVVK
jgi:hypothetical protein